MLRLELYIETTEADYLNPEVAERFVDILNRIARNLSASPDAMAKMTGGLGRVQVDPRDDRWRVSLDVKGKWDDIW